MNPEIDIIEEYFSKLPDVVQDCVTSKEWQRRIAEIVTKYSLNSKQVANLQYEIIFVVLGIEPEQDLSENIKNEVGVSGLLAEQLAEDVKERLLSWVDRIYNTNEQTTENKKEKESVDVEIPEIRPEITPMTESGEIAHDVPHQEITQNEPTGETPSQNQQPTPEPVQRPIPVPRFTGTPEEKEEVKPIEPTKLPEQAPQPDKNYTVDPYREPLE
jgi:hypothetical protein